MNLSKIVVAILAYLTFLSANAQGGTSCSTASIINTKGSYSADHTISTTQWYAYTSTTQKNIELSNCNTFPSYLAYKIDDCSADSIIATNTCFQAGVRTNLLIEANQTLYFAFITDLPVSYNWTIDWNTPALGDFCTTPLTLTSGSNNISDLSNETKHFSYTALANGWLHLDACSANLDIEFTSQTSCTSTPQVISNHCTHNGFSGDIPLSEGQTINLALSGTSGDFLLELNEYKPNTGDICSLPESITSGNFITRIGNDSTLWKTYTASRDEELSISNCGSTAADMQLHSSCNQTISAPNTCTTNGYTYTQQLSKGQEILISLTNTTNTQADIEWSILSTETTPTTGDNCSNAIALEDLGNYTVDIANEIAWYSYTPTTNGNITLSTCTFTSEDSYIEYYTDCENNFLGDADQECDDQAQLTTSLTANTTYYFLFYNDLMTSDYDFSFDFEATTPQAGDNCTLPIAANIGSNIASHSNGDQWYSYTPNQNTMLTISSCSQTSEDTEVTLYEADCNTQLLSAQDNCNAQSEITFEAQAQQTYLIKWSGEWTTASYNWLLTESPITATHTPLTEQVFYPNPSSNYITCTHSGQVQIINTKGEIVVERNVAANTSINIADLETGLYLLKIQDDENIKTNRLTIEK